MAMSKRETKAAKGEAAKRIVLVGTYRKQSQQLPWIVRHHLYNYPLSKEEADKEDWGRVKELWLYSGARDRRHIYAANFVGVKSRKDFLTEHPDYPTGGSRSSATVGRAVSMKPPRPHGDYYAVFKVTHKYQPTIEDSVVTVRVKDFAKRTPKVAKAIKAYQAGGELGCLLDYLPAALAPLKHNQLRVCEAAVQLDFFDVFDASAED